MDDLAGRTVWSVSAVPGGWAAAEKLERHLEWAREGGVAAGQTRLPVNEPLARLASRLESMLRGSRSPLAPSEQTDSELYACGAASGETLVGQDVSAEDVVVFQDALGPAMARAVRERGAYAVWHVRLGRTPAGVAATEAWGLLSLYASALDAYLMTWSRRSRPGATMRGVAALMPAPDLVAAKEMRPEQRQGIGWGSALADVVEVARGERVGGTLRPRPAVSRR